MLAGPPFLTDDPDPVAFQHGELYLATMYTHDASGTSGTLPHLEVNRGVAPDLMIHTILPYAFQQSAGSGTSRGYGDTEVGAKYRFVQQGKYCPMLGIFPLVEIPSGSVRRGLGSGHYQEFLPLWLQKSWSDWTVYGGGGYWITPGAGKQNYWFHGLVVQNQIAPRFMFGVELNHTTATEVGGQQSLAYNLGGQYDFNEGHHLLFSCGHSLTGVANVTRYLALQWTYGPSSAKQAPTDHTVR